MEAAEAKVEAAKRDEAVAEGKLEAIEDQLYEGDFPEERRKVLEDRKNRTGGRAEGAGLGAKRTGDRAEGPGRHAELPLETS